jgi:hypothetical protein
MTVQSEIENIGFQYNNVGSAIVNIENTITPLQHSQPVSSVIENEFELYDDQYKELINNLKSSIIELGVYSNADLKISFADFTSLSVDASLISLNKLLAEIVGDNLNKHITKHKIARIKELLVLSMMISCLPKLQPVCITDAQQN